MKEVGIVGGGISGLLAAYFLIKRGIRVKVFESTSRCGGWLSSEFVDGNLIEWGPNTLMADSQWLRLATDLNLAPLFPAPLSRARYIWKNARRFSVPMGLGSLISSSLISWAAKKSLLMDLISKRKPPTQDSSISDFCTTYLHSEILDYLVEPMVRGIFSGNVDELSMEACFPKLWRGFQKKGSIIRGLLSQKGPRRRMLSFPKGLEEITKALAHELGASVFLSHSVEKISFEADQRFKFQTSHGAYAFSDVILASPSMVTAELLRSHLPASSVNFMLSIPYRRVAVWNCIFKRPENFVSGFGCLIPRTEKTQTLGSLWSSEIFRERSRGDQIVASQFFSGQDIPENPEVELPLLQKILGVSEEPLYSKMKIYPKAIPQFSLGHADSVRRLRENLPSRVHLVGNYLDGVGLTSVFETADSVTRSISA